MGVDTWHFQALLTCIADTTAPRGSGCLSAMFGFPKLERVGARETLEQSPWFQRLRRALETAGYTFSWDPPGRTYINVHRFDSSLRSAGRERKRLDDLFHEIDSENT